MVGIVPGTTKHKSEHFHNRTRAPIRLALLIHAVLLLLGLAIAAPSPALGQTAASQGRRASEPYTGDLSIFDSPGRDERLHVDQVMQMLGVEPGKSVADIGAGSGWFSVRAARRVMDSGTVYAVDINPKAVEYISRRARDENLHNIKPILSTSDDPKLPANSVDCVLLLKTYHEVAHPVALLSNLRAALRPGAKIGIIDRNGNGTDHGVDKKIVIREAGRAGYRLVDQADFVKDDGMDYFLILEASN
jgi:SAM-dependent methyltransferase